MAFAAAVMSTSAGHRAFSKTSNTTTTNEAISPVTPPRSGAGPLSITSSHNNNNNAAMASQLNPTYINQFNTTLSSFMPRSPPGSQTNATSFSNNNNAPSMPESPHMIRCSTCNSLVPLAELSDHTCRPSAPSSSNNTPVLVPPARQASVQQHARLASGFTHNAPHQAASSASAASASPSLSAATQRSMLNPLRVNISRAPQSGFEAPLPTPYRTPLPRSPSSQSHSPSTHSHSPSPGTSPAGNTLSPAYPFESQQQHHLQAHQRFPSSDGERHPSSRGYTSRTQAHSPTYYEAPSAQPQVMAGSPSSRSDIDLSAENNAGIGARMPFYERLQQERALASPVITPSPSSPSLSPGALAVSQYSPPLSARSQSNGNAKHNQKPWSNRPEQKIYHEMPKTPISPGWSGLADEEPDLFKRFEPRLSEGTSHLDEQDRQQLEEGEEEEEERRRKREIAESGRKLEQNARTNQALAHQQLSYQQKVHQQHAHIRETSDSGQSSAMSHSYSDHLDYFIKDGSSPDTSPEIPEVALFKSASTSITAASSSSSSVSGGLAKNDEYETSRVHEREEEEDDYQGYDDDIIDSYPTPQQNFSGRFGGLVIDDDPVSEAYHNRAAQESSARKLQQEDDSLTSVHEPTIASSPLLRAHSDRAAHESTPALRPLGRGIPASHSTPNNLSRLAAASTDKNNSNLDNNDIRSNSGRNESAIPFTQRRRLHSEDASSASGVLPSVSTRDLKKSGGTPSPTSATTTTPTEGSGLKLDACLDDLLKEMNRESIDTLPAVASGSRSPLSLIESELSTTPTSPEAASSSSRRPFDDGAHQTDNREIRCGSCDQVVKNGQAVVERDGQHFCSECYAQLYLPKCRKCRLPIEDKAIGSGDGKVKGKFHIGCFSCFSCSAPFPTGDFYVFGSRPYCAQHYHERNGTLCANPSCDAEQRGIEGPCVSLVGEESGNGGRYHPGCFKCSEGTCEILLDQYHYVLGGLPYCEQHAREIEDQDTMPSTAQSVSPPRTTEDGGDFYDARYGNGVPPVTNTASIPEARRRSASLDIPAQSLNALRKNAQAPNYRGMLARRRSSARRRPSETGNLGGWNHQHAAASQQYQQSMRSAAGPPPVSRTRRAEKRRTVISQIRLH